MRAAAIREAFGLFLGLLLLLFRGCGEIRPPFPQAFSNSAEETIPADEKETSTEKDRGDEGGQDLTEEAEAPGAEEGQIDSDPAANGEVGFSDTERQPSGVDEVPLSDPSIPGAEEYGDTAPQVHEHTWEPVTETVIHEALTHTEYHEAVTHTVAHEAVTHTVYHEEEGHFEEVCVREAWEEPVYTYVDVCNGCGEEVTGSYLYHECENWGTYHAEPRQTGSTPHEAEFESRWVVDQEAYTEIVVDVPAWEETVVDQEAWTEEVTDREAYAEEVIVYWRCEECGEVSEMVP